MKSGILFFLLTLLILQVHAQENFRVHIAEDFGIHMGHSLYRLQGLDTLNQAPVRVMIYGQSITNQDWWKAVRTYFNTAFLQVEVEVVNRAVGGFAANRLKHMARQDVLEVQPDLILFHVYGSEDDYMEIMQTFYDYSIADVLILNNHFAPAQEQEYHDRFSYQFLPAICDQFNFSLIEVRKNWVNYLKHHDYEGQELLSDKVHLNEQGNALMADIIIRHIGQALQQNIEYAPHYRFIPIGQLSETWTTDAFALQLIWQQNHRPDSALPQSIRIDGKPPCELPENYGYSRPVGAGWETYPPAAGFPIAFEFEQPVEGNWLLRVGSSDTTGRELVYRLYHNGKQVKRSAKSQKPVTAQGLTLLPEAWFYRFRPGEFTVRPTLQPGDTLTWTTYCRAGKWLTSRQQWIVLGMPPELYPLQWENSIEFHKLIQGILLLTRSKS